MLKLCSVLIVAIILSGCNLLDNEAVKFVKYAVSGDIENVWKNSAKEAVDETLADSEKQEALRKFRDDWPKSLPYSLKDLKDIIENKPDIDEIGSKKDGDKTIYALTATYDGVNGYLYGEGEVAKVIKFSVEINNKTGLVVDVDFEKVLERNEKATSGNQQSVANELYLAFKANKSGNKSNIRKILKMYSNSDLPIKELNDELLRVNQLITNKSFQKLVTIINSGGYSSEGSKISMGAGFGTKLEHYVELENLTFIPLVVKLNFDLEYSNYETDKVGENWLGQPKYKTTETRYIEKESVRESLKLHALEKDYENSYFDDLKYYRGYRVTQQRSDGSYSYNWDETKSYGAKNLKITSVSIWGGN